MDNETLKALQESIKHWEEICKAENVDQVNIQANDCPLCHKFLDASYSADETGCRGCPVKEETDYPSCEFSPWEDVSRAKLDWVVAVNTRDFKYIEKYKEKFIEAAKIELEFLKSLLPDT